MSKETITFLVVTLFTLIAFVWMWYLALSGYGYIGYREYDKGPNHWGQTHYYHSHYTGYHGGARGTTARGGGTRGGK